MTNEELLSFLAIPFKFWACPDCPDSKIAWDDSIATCLDCGKKNKHPTQKFMNNPPEAGETTKSTDVGWGTTAPTNSTIEKIDRGMEQLLGLLLQPFLDRAEAEDITSTAEILIGIVEDRSSQNRARSAISKAVAISRASKSDPEEAVKRYVGYARLFLVAGTIADELDLEDLEQA